MGPALFSLALKNLTDSLASELSVAYRDEITLGGELSVVPEDVRKVRGYAGPAGLHLNASKCELFVPPTRLEDLLEAERRAALHEQIKSLLPGVRLLDAESLELLGVPLFPKAFEPTFSAKTKQLQEVA